MPIEEDGQIVSLGNSRIECVRGYFKLCQAVRVVVLEYSQIKRLIT